MIAGVVDTMVNGPRVGGKCDWEGGITVKALKVQSGWVVVELHYNLCLLMTQFASQ